LGSLPARLIASAEICSLFAETGPPESLASEALSTYRELIEGVWRLDKYQYAYYSDKLRGWLEAGPPSGEFLQWRSQEAQKLALSSAADQLLQNPQRVIRTDAGPALAIWRAEPFAGLVLAPGHFGADDYITKPFSSRELKARIKAVLRRTSPSAKDGRSEKVFEFGNVRVDFDKFELRRKGRKIELTALEFKLLRAFLAHRGKLLSIDQLFAEVWDKDACLTDRVIYTHVNNLRNKIEDDPSHPRFLIGVRGLGYRFDG
jgi:DNA-binding winged helix-turn-helix (wHTH) protein